MTLCSNRTDAYSRTCLTDEVWQPLPTWLLLISLVFLFLSTRHATASRVLPLALPKWLVILDLIIIAACFALQVLEITRLGIADLGVGLLPFVLVGLLITFVLNGARMGLWAKQQLAAQRRPLSLILLGFWFLSFIFEAVKVGEASTLSGKGPSDYPNSDRVSDTAIILAFYIVLFLLEGFASYRDRRVLPEQHGELQMASNG